MISGNLWEVSILCTDISDLNCKWIPLVFWLEWHIGAFLLSVHLISWLIHETPPMKSKRNSAHSAIAEFSEFFHEKVLQQMFDSLLRSLRIRNLLVVYCLNTYLVPHLLADQRVHPKPNFWRGITFNCIEKKEARFKRHDCQFTCGLLCSYGSNVLLLNSGII